jgi:hypothetical protein
MWCTMVLIMVALIDFFPSIYHHSWILAMVFLMFPNYTCHEINSTIKSIKSIKKHHKRSSNMDPQCWRLFFIFHLKKTIIMVDFETLKKPRTIDKPRLKCNLIDKFHCHSPLHFNPLDWNCSINPWCYLFKMMLVDNYKVQHLLMRKWYKWFNYILHLLWIVEIITNLVFDFWNDGHKYEGEIYEYIRMNTCRWLICFRM